MSCQYQGYEFGANYLDSVCIDGFLWDADSGYGTEEGWNYTHGGDIPCPLCYFKSAVSRLGEGLLQDRYQGNRDPKNLNPPNRKWFLNQARRRLRAYLIREGWQGGRVAEQEGK